MADDRDSLHAVSAAGAYRRCMPPFPFRPDLPCTFCGLPTGAGRICAACLDVLPWNATCCEWCGQPIATELPPGVHCAACQRLPPAFDLARAVFRYRFPVDAALRKFKYDGQLAFGPAFAGLLLPVLESVFADSDALVPVPLHGWRHVRRGFNQAELLCRPLSRATGLPVDHDVRRVRATQSQSGLSAAQRRKNLQGAFRAGGGSYRRPLIIDDVITTGATVNRLAEELRRAGALEVRVLAVARAEFL